MQYLTLNTAMEWTCFLTSLVCLRADKDRIWKWFPLYLFIVCFVETCGIYIRTVLHQSNAGFYNLYLPVECFFVSLFLFRLLHPYGIKRYILVAWLGLFLALYITESVSNQFLRYSFQTVVFMSTVFVLASLYYFFLVLKDSRYIGLGTYPPFWWVSGVLMFYFGGVATYVFFTYLLKGHETGGVRFSVRYVLFKVLNVLLYGSWTYSFICRYRQMK